MTWSHVLPTVTCYTRSRGHLGSTYSHVLPTVTCYTRSRGYLGSLYRHVLQDGLFCCCHVTYFLGITYCHVTIYLTAFITQVIDK